jgi:hypothetical protein
METEQRAPGGRTEGTWRQNRGHLEAEKRAPCSLYEYLLRVCYRVQIEVKLKMLQSRILLFRVGRNIDR